MHHPLRGLVLASLGALTLAACGGGGGGDEAPTFRLSHNFSSEHTLGVFAQDVADNAAQNGAVELQIYPTGQLHSELDLVDALPAGNADIGIINVAQWSGKIPASQIFDVPFTFDGIEGVHAAVDGEMGEYLEGKFAEQNTVILGWTDYEFLQYAGNSSTVEPASMRGVKVRVPSALASEAVKLVGGSAVTMSGSEVYLGLERGTIDGAFSGYTSFDDRAYYEVAPHVTELDLTYAMFALAMNKSKYESLTPEQRESLQAAVDDAVQTHREVQIGNIEESKKFVRDEGMTIHELTDDERTAWREATSPVHDSFVKLVGSDGEMLLNLASGETGE